MRSKRGKGHRKEGAEMKAMTVYNRQEVAATANVAAKFRIQVFTSTPETKANGRDSYQGT